MRVAQGQTDEELMEAYQSGDTGAFNEAHPIGGDGGTDISNALVATFNKIAEHQRQGGELDRANVLLITDGQDQIRVSEIDTARKRIDPKTEIILNAISLGNSNPDLERLVQDGANRANQGALGKLSYQYVSETQIGQILDSLQRRNNIEDAAKELKVGSVKSLV